MKIVVALVVALALTLDTAAAQSGSSSVGAASATKSGAGKANAPKIVVRSGGQGHNSTSGPKGKIQVAPTTPAASSGKRTSSANSQPNGH